MIAYKKPMPFLLIEGSSVKWHHNWSIIPLISKWSFSPCPSPFLPLPSPSFLPPSLLLLPSFPFCHCFRSAFPMKKRESKHARVEHNVSTAQISYSDPLIKTEHGTFTTPCPPHHQQCHGHGSFETFKGFAVSFAPNIG